MWFVQHHISCIIAMTHSFSAQNIFSTFKWAILRCTKCRACRLRNITLVYGVTLYGIAFLYLYSSSKYILKKSKVKLPPISIILIGENYLKIRTKTICTRRTDQQRTEGWRDTFENRIIKTQLNWYDCHQAVQCWIENMVQGVH